MPINLKTGLQFRLHSRQINLKNWLCATSEKENKITFNVFRKNKWITLRLRQRPFDLCSITASGCIAVSLFMPDRIAVDQQQQPEELSTLQKKTAVSLAELGFLLFRNRVTR
jgi:hypothetical protein